MFGIIRTFLAFTVMAAHYGKWTDLRGANAVESFFVISGFMMTATLQKNYGFTLQGFHNFLKNRLLRIFPLYWIAAALSLSLIYLFPAQSLAMQRNMTPPHSVEAWLTLLTNWYWMPDFSPGAHVSHAVPPAWALSVEFIMYIALAIWASRNWRSGLTMLLAGAVYHATHFHDVNARIYDITAASLSYGLGVCTYFFTKRIDFKITIIASSTIILLFFLIISNLHKAPLNGSGLPFYANIALTAIVICVCQWTRLGRSASLLDKQIGSLSYPVYLTHYQCAIASIVIAGGSLDGWQLFLASLPIVILVSTCLELINRTLIDPKRDLIRAKAVKA